MFILLSIRLLASIASIGTCVVISSVIGHDFLGAVNASLKVLRLNGDCYRAQSVCKLS